MNDFWIVPTFEQVKAKKYVANTNYNIGKTAGMRDLYKVVVRELARTKLLNHPTKHEASKRGYKHQHKATYMPTKATRTPAQWKRERRTKHG